MNKTIKILCTIGPSSMNGETIRRLDSLGVDIFRINLSHTNESSIEKSIAFIKKYTDKPICLDTEGAQIRNGPMSSGRVTFIEGTPVLIHREKITGDYGNIWLNPSHVIDDLEPGDLISVDFDTLLLRVDLKRKAHLKTTVISAGSVGSNKAVTIDRHIELPPLSQKDIKAIAIGKRYAIRHIALSFANSRDDVKVLRDLVGKKTCIISKIESKKGVANLDTILTVSDAILIDRGDLSREETIESLPFLQKEIIEAANNMSVPVYVATNLLESMVHQKTPTRAEVNDIMNTLLDGADGLVLAAETAIGSYPVECVAMIKRMIRSAHSRASAALKANASDRYDTSLILNDPHGGHLIRRMIAEPDRKLISKMKKLYVDDTVLADAEQIATGTYSPIDGFMTREELDSVLNDYKMPSGTIWTLPIVLQCAKDEAAHIRSGDDVALVSRSDDIIYAALRVDDKFRFDIKNTAKLWFGTDRLDHPGVKRLNDNGELFLGGKVRLIKRLDTGLGAYTLTPSQTRHIFEKKCWNTVVGFHTRNVIHRVHEHIQLAALEKYGIDGLFIHPVIGPKKKHDFMPEIIIKSYSLMQEKYYPKNRTLLGAFLTYSRYAGPREAVFTALCRKNFGCTHFIVGRDHTGVGDFYNPNDSRRLFETLGDIGITPIFFNEMHYCAKCVDYVEKCSHPRGSTLRISGTEARNMLKHSKPPPDWFMRKEISKLVLKEMASGNEVFVQ